MKRPDSNFMDAESIAKIISDGTMIVSNRIRDYTMYQASKQRHPQTNNNGQKLLANRSTTSWCSIICFNVMVWQKLCDELDTEGN